MLVCFVKLIFVCLILSTVVVCWATCVAFCCIFAVRFWATISLTTKCPIAKMPKMRMNVMKPPAKLVLFVFSALGGLTFDSFLTFGSFSSTLAFARLGGGGGAGVSSLTKSGLKVREFSYFSRFLLSRRVSCFLDFLIVSGYFGLTGGGTMGGGTGAGWVGGLALGGCGAFATTAGLGVSERLG